MRCVVGFRADNAIYRIAKSFNLRMINMANSNVTGSSRGSGRVKTSGCIWQLERKQGLRRSNWPEVEEMLIRKNRACLWPVYLPLNTFPGKSNS